MTTALYARLARMNIRGNRKIYLPYILTSVGMVAMFYIVCFLATDREVGRIGGGATLQAILGFGMGVVAVFAAIFLFYTNSFVMKRRKKELGLYNVLGMGKRHIARVLLWETGFVVAVSLAAGLCAGALLSKLGQLVMLKLVGAAASFDFSVSGLAILMTAALFAGVFFLILMNSFRQVHVSSPAELLRSGSAGEREPKANYALAALGALLLGAGYYLALTVDDPMAALAWFFIAVILVILGTYLLFIAGSVALIKMLRRNKRYYYQTHHFVSVSGMFYRMKRNGAGLASICILSTMVLVMISTTTCLYLGADDILRARYPRNISIATDTASPDAPQPVARAVERALKEAGTGAENLLEYRCIAADVQKGDGPAREDGAGGQSLRAYVIPAEDYTQASGKALILQKGEAVVCGEGAKVGDTLRFGGSSYRVGQTLDAFDGADEMDFSGCIYVFVPGVEDLLAINSMQKSAPDEDVPTYTHYYRFDVPADREAQAALTKAIRSELATSSPDSFVRGAAESWADFLSIYGGLLFLGLLLGLTFILAAVLIMYYKQVTEGYEDNARFDIMKKVGMTGQEIRKTIHSQVLTVFALPLIAAAVHMAFAFPMVSKLLQVFGLTNAKLFASFTVATILLFACFYVAAYLMTSRAYLAIIGGADGRTGDGLR